MLQVGGPHGAWLICSAVLGAFVSAGSTTCRKRLAAVTAPVGLLAGVDPLMPRNLVLLAEPPRAHRASVGLLTGVGPLV